MNRIFSGVLIGVALASAAGCTLPGSHPAPQSTVWTFDRLDAVGSAATHVEGQPQLIDTPAGKAALFNGVDDALFVDTHPLAGASTFTEEAIFRPDGGAFEQRFLHLAERDSATGTETGARFLMEIRVVGDRWYLDAFVNGPGYNQTMAVKEKTFPVGPWYSVAQSFDGKMFRSYVNGELQMEAAVPFRPQRQGHTSIGTRINRVNYFHGAILEARFTPAALAPGDLLSVPASLNAATGK